VGLCSGGEYVPGDKGGPWTAEEHDVVRAKVLEMINPLTRTARYGHVKSSFMENVMENNPTENRLLRLAFHDCVRYEDGTGGCDGCLNWKHMGFRYKNFFKLRFPIADRKPKKYYDVVRTGDNNGLAELAFYLEKIYTEVDWPSNAPVLSTSLKSSGKSRADLWAFAANVALERSIERANYACDHDYTTRQQITLLEGRDKCDIKLTRPIKFYTGRVDCIPDPSAELPYIAVKEEVQPSPFGSGDEVLAYMKENFGMTARHTTALMAVHSAANNPPLNIAGMKYTWFGNGYLSSFYYKLIANRPIYHRNFHGAERQTGFKEAGKSIPALGDVEGKPLALTNWRVHCSPIWNTTDGGPCFVRPTIPECSEDNPESSKLLSDCSEGFDANGNRILKNKPHCSGTTFTEDGVQIGGSSAGRKHSCQFNLQFGLPYELGLYNKMTYDPVTLRPKGCPGLDIARNEFIKRPTYGTPVMHCNRNDNAPEGEPVYKIVEEFADDHDAWAKDFLDGWDQMTTNGAEGLDASAQEGWLGHYSLRDTVENIGDYEAYIVANAPLVFTNPNPDIKPFTCNDCYVRFS